jgi:predicted phage-related endonuclease
MASERIFWNCVENDIPPSVDASESAAKALQLLYPQHIPLQTVDFSTLEGVDQLFTDLLHEEKQLTDHQTKYDYLKHRIQALMKDAEKAIFSNGTVTWKKSKTVWYWIKRHYYRHSLNYCNSIHNPDKAADALIFILQQPKSSD